jgi:GT2 family glycosyltransferase
MVLDDASSQCQLEGTVGQQFLDDRLHFLRSETPLGVARGRNLLMARATGDIFVIIDDDACFESNDALDRIAGAFRSNRQAGIIACKVVLYQPGREQQLQLPFSQRVRQRQPMVTDSFGKVSYFVGCGHAIRRDVIANCGPYSEVLTYGEEELELSFRAIEAGFSIYYLPDVVLNHYPEPSVVARPPNIKHPELYYHTHNRFYLAYRYLPWRYIPVYLSIWLLQYSIEAIKTGGIAEVLAGIRDGLGTVSRTKRTALGPQAVKYLQTNYGRLWY